MDPARYARIQEIFDAVVDLDPAAREAHLSRACGDDDELRREIESLLALTPDANTPEHPFSDERIDESRRRIKRLLSDEADTAADPRSVDVPTAPVVPDRLGRYRIIRRIATGGMGTVYEAEQDHPMRRVAIKVIDPRRSSPALVSRFHREAEILGRLKHPGIARIHDAGTVDVGEGAQPYLVMELVEGDPLTKHADTAKLDFRGRLDLLARICDAVDYAHERGVIHRDIKPDNILIEADGTPKVLDFGIARATDDSTMVATQMTQDGQLLGTLTYMAPEQLDRSTAAVSPRTDVYALGVVAFELLAGRRPHDVSGLGLGTAVRLLSDEEVPSLGTLVPRARGDVETIVGKALDKDPARRYASAAALATDLRRYLADEPITARPPTRIYRIRKFTRRNRVLVGGVLATILALALGLVIAVALTIRANDLRLRAEANERTAMINELRGLAALYRSAQSDLEAGRDREAARSLAQVPGARRDWVWHHLKRRAPAVHEGSEAIGKWPHLTDDGRRILLDRNDDGKPPFLRDVYGHRPDEAPWPDLDVTRLLTRHGSRVALVRGSGAIEVRDLDGGPVGTVTLAGHGPFEPLSAVFDPTGDTLVVHGDLATTMTGAGIGGPTAITNGRAERLRLDGIVDATPIDHDGRGLVVCLEPADDWDAAAPSVVVLDGVTGAEIARRDTGILRKGIPSRASEQWWGVHPYGREVVIADGQFLLGHDLLTLAPNGKAYEGWDTGRVTDVMYSADGRFVLARWANDVVRELEGLIVWEVETAALVGRIDGTRAQHSSPEAVPVGVGGYVTGFAADGTIAGYDRHQQPWTMHVEELNGIPDFTELEGTTKWIYHLAVSPDGSLIAAMSPAAPEVLLWDTVTGRLLARAPRTVSMGFDMAGLLAFSADGRSLLVTERRDGTGGVRRVDLATGAASFVACPLPGGFADAAGPALDGRLSQEMFALPHDAGFVRTDSRLDDGAPATVVNAHGEAIRPIAGRADCDCVAPRAGAGEMVVSAPGGIAIRALDGGAHLRDIDLAYSGPVLSLACSPDERLLAAGTNDGRVFIVETTYDTTLISFQACRLGLSFAGSSPTEPKYDYVRDIRWTPDGTRLITAFGNGRVRVWDSRRVGERAHERRAHAAALATMREWLRSADDEALILADPRLAPADRAAARIAAIERWGDGPSAGNDTPDRAGVSQETAAE